MDEQTKRPTLVACLNVWNDLPDLEANWATWYPYVDRVVAVDGAYEGTPVDRPDSTDGTVEYLQQFKNVKVVTTNSFWSDQCVKRSVYFQHGRPGDTFLVVDADEQWHGLDDLGDLPPFDVGWVTYRSPIYRRWQHTPRLIRWRKGLGYDKRHHWLHVQGTPLYTHQLGAPGFEHRRVGCGFVNTRGLYRSTERIVHANQARNEQFRREAAVSGPNGIGHEALHVFQVGPFDPGHVVYRLHSGINAGTPHWSAMLTGDGAFEGPHQHRMNDVGTLRLAREIWDGADVIHYHIHDVAKNLLRVEDTGKCVVMHHHGTEYRRNPEAANEREAGLPLRFVSNLELMQYGEGLTWLPNPIPVARYRRMARSAKWKKGHLTVFHSPSKPEIKGTAVLEQAVDLVRKTGITVHLEYLHPMPLREVLEAKLTSPKPSPVCFDSFSLGIQCSGLEAGVRMPVVAGDTAVVAGYRDLLGACPYTFATPDSLAELMERLATDRTFYHAERRKVGAYVAEHHDTPRVVATYLEVLDTAFGWRERLRLGVLDLPLGRAS